MIVWNVNAIRFRHFFCRLPKIEKQQLNNKGWSLLWKFRHWHVYTETCVFVKNNVNNCTQRSTNVRMSTLTKWTLTIEDHRHILNL